MTRSIRYTWPAIKKPVPTSRELTLMSYRSVKDEVQVVDLWCEGCKQVYTELLSGAISAVINMRFRHLRCIQCDQEADY